MRKISYYVIAVVVAGVAITSLFVYQRYFKVAEQPFLYFTVDRGDIQEAIKVRSEVVAQKEFELEFPLSGTVEAVYVKDGEAVKGGQRLMKLETTNLNIQARQLQAVVAQRKADLAKTLSGATPEEIRVSESKLANAQVGLTEARNNLSDKIRNAYSKSDDAVRTKTNRLFDNPQSAQAALNIYADSNVTSDLNYKRRNLEIVFNDWDARLATIGTSSDLTSFVRTAEQNTSLVSIFLNILSPVVANLTANPTISQTTIDTYKTDISAARTEVTTAVIDLTAAEEKYNLAVTNVTLYEEELALKRSPARSEDVEIAQAKVSEAEGELAATEEQISKSTLYAPTAGKISKVHYEVGEVFRPAQSAISMVTDGYKLQSDVSELDIAKVREQDGNNVRIVLDAFPNQQYDGKVVSVDAQEIIKTEDKYYRVNIIFDAAGANLRAGMSADATILSAMKKGVLRVPELAVYTDDRSKYVKVLLPGLDKAVSEDSLGRVPIKTGITDGDFVEITGGDLREGQIVAVSAE